MVLKGLEERLEKLEIKMNRVHKDYNIFEYLQESDSLEKTCTTQMKDQQLMLE